jgi:HAD superfamily hydrolase (TIGR01549 family)
MSGTWTGVKAVVFDYGNTLVPFGVAEISHCDGALTATLQRLFGAVDDARVRAVRHRNRLAPYAGDPPEWRENDLHEISAELVREVAGRDPSPGEIEAILRIRYEAFVEAIRLPDGIRPLLERLQSRFRLALLSNYPDGAAIRATLDRIGLTDLFDAVVVSADHGVVKPHPRLFAEVERQLGVGAAGMAMVGDNWLADVQGAKRAGWRAVWVTQYDPPEEVARRGPGVEPDAVVERLGDIEALFRGAAARAAPVWED